MTNERLQESSEALVELQTEIALKQARAAATRRQCMESWASEWDGFTCLECEDDLPVQRIALGRVRCVKCQAYIELHGGAPV